MLLKYNRGVNGEPVAKHNQQRVQPTLEVVNANDPEYNIDDGSEDADERARDGLKPRVESLCGESEGVHVGNVICDDPECEDYETELTKATSWIEGRAEESTDGVLLIAFRKSGG